MKKLLLNLTHRIAGQLIYDQDFFGTFISRQLLFTVSNNCLGRKRVGLLFKDNHGCHSRFLQNS